MRTQIRRLWREEDGATMVEYALLVAAIGLALVVVLSAITGSLSVLFNSVANAFPDL